MRFPSLGGEDSAAPGTGQCAVSFSAVGVNAGSVGRPGPGREGRAWRGVEGSPSRATARRRTKSLDMTGSSNLVPVLATRRHCAASGGPCAELGGPLSSGRLLVSCPMGVERLLPFTEPREATAACGGPRLPFRLPTKDSAAAVRCSLSGGLQSEFECPAGALTEL